MGLASREWQADRGVPAFPSLVVPLWPALFAVTVVGALALRLVGLDSPPLAPDEAAVAMEARSIWRGTGGDYTAGPVLPNILSLWFALFTTADASARVPSAIAGLGVCLSPLLFRSRLGSLPALTSCGLLAISPIGVLASRSSHPAIMATLAGTLAAGCCLRAFETSNGRWLLGTGVALGAGLGTAPTFIGQIASIGVAAALFPPIARSSDLDLRHWAPRAGLAGLVSALLLDTLLLTRPPGLQAGLVDPFAAWLLSIGPARTTLLSAGLLGAHEVLLLGMAAVGILLGKPRPFGRFLQAWVLAGLTLALLQRSPDLTALLGPIVPLALLGGMGAGRLDVLHRTAQPAVWLAAAGALAPAVFLVVALNNTANRAGTLSPAPFLIALGGLLAVLLLASVWFERSNLTTAICLAATIALVLLEISLLARLNYVGFERGGPALLGESSRVELRQVEERARHWWRQDPVAPIRVEASLRPLLEWALRDGPPVDWAATTLSTTERTILRDEAVNPPQADWLRLVVAEQYDPRVEPINPLAIWRWIVLRTVSGGLVRSEPYAILLSQ